ncbi:MAG: hypothetical protein JNL52_09410 [Flavobacteriales bacterium]|nr:hypothetical protein [Flavobacteriales bacterium]
MNMLLPARSTIDRSLGTWMTLVCISMGGLLFTAPVQAQQPGTVDLSFNATDVGYGAGDGPVTNALNALAIQADGGVLIGGNLQRFNNVQRNNLVRLSPDGSVDLAFAPTALGDVYDLVVQPDGRILVADGLVRRLLPNGTEDPSFQGGACCAVRRLQLQPDGSILAVAEEAPFNPNVVRLLPTGELDPSFAFAHPGYASSDFALLPNGQFLMLMDVGGSGTRRLIRFNSDGSEDGTFNCCPGPSGGGIGRFVVQPDGRILVSGAFTTYHGAARPRLVRLESNGDVDLSFNANLTNGEQIRALALRPDGRILCSGTFANVQGLPRPGLVQFLANGTVDPAFTVGTGFGPSTPSVDGPRNIAVDTSGRVVCMGTFSSCQGAVRIRLARLLSNGALDAEYHRQTGVLGTVQGITMRSDGSMLVAGIFSNVNGAPRRGLARLLPDGTLDPSFVTASTAIPSILYRVAEQSTGKAVVMGQIGGSTYVVSRINTDGSPDPGFSTGSGFNGTITDIAVQPDDKIIACGAFTAYNGTAVGRIVRLLPDGQIDPAFNTGSGFSGLMAQVSCVRLQPDGKVLVGGNFSQFNGSSAIDLIRLNSDGTRDSGFNAIAPGDIRRISLRADGRILIAYNSLVNHIACLLPTGAQDTGFNNGINIGTAVNEIIDLGSGGILVAGLFSVPGSPALTGYRLLTASGQPDASFAPGSGLGNPNSGLGAVAHCAAVQADGRILIGGQFTACNGVGRNRITRLFGVTASPGLLVSARAMLDGPFSTGLMSDALRAASLIPAMEPYTALGYAHAGGGGGEQVSSSVLAVTGNNAIVDWVVVELRDPLEPATIYATRSALIQRDGDVVGLDGTSPVSFSLPAGSYRVAIRHRNHLGVMTATPLALSATPTTIDLTSSATTTWGTDARKNNNGTMTLWPGDANFDGVVRYTGQNNDRDVVLQAVGGITPTNTVTGYFGSDVNMNGVVSYTGANNDRDLILQTIGGVVPTAVRVQQLP